MGRTLSIGDIHGGLEALKQVWERAEVDVNDTIIFLGDYVDGWSDSFSLIEHLIELNKVYRCIFLQGNHDVWCGDWLVSGVVPVLGTDFTWRDSGGTTTINSYMNRPPSNLDEHIKFFRTLHHYYEDEEDRVFIHAGFTQGGGVRFENPTKNLWWDRSLLEKAYNHETRFNKESELYNEYFPIVLKTYKEIFVGHTTTQMYGTTQPVNVCNVWNLDTGGGHRHGRLTIMDVDTKEYWQSDRLKDLYPDDPHNDYFRDTAKNLE